MKPVNEDEKRILKAYIKDFIDKNINAALNDMIVKNSIPVVWFGDIDKYRASKTKVITIALNPSKEEFSEKRFDTINFPKVGSDENIESLLTPLRETLNAYFRTNPYNWFNSAEHAVNAFDASFYDSKKSNTAIHIDIYTAIATDPTWGRLGKDIKEKLQRTDLFKQLLDYLDPDIMLVSVGEEIFNEVFGDYVFNCEKYEKKYGNSYIKKYHKDKRTLFWIGNYQGTAFGPSKEFITKAIQEFQGNEQLHRVILFPHPGDEHPVDKNSNIKEWNEGKHYRKFMVVNGKLVRSTKTGGNPETAKITFWGEWESESTYSSIQYKDENGNEMPPEYGMPLYVHKPQCYRNEIFDKLKNERKSKKDNFIDEAACLSFYNNGKQNTDPYVFGKQFMYSCCKQTGSNALSNLQKGDVIIFYGQKGKKKTGNYKCHIDTVFVVGGIIGKGKYSDMFPELLQNNRLSDQFIFKTILPILYGNKEELGKNADSKEFVLYYGATYDEPVNGMFSYFPCKTVDGTVDDNMGFKRFECDPFKKHRVGKSYEKCSDEDKFFYPDSNVAENNYETPEEVIKFWEKLTQNILNAGYSLGVKAREPNPQK